MSKVLRKGYEAILKFVLVSPYRVRPIADLIRRKPCSEALAMLENMPHRGARLMWKTVKSAVGNAVNADNRLSEDMLYVSEVMVDEGPRMKRVWFRARGRADMLFKRMSHIKVVVDETAKVSM